MRLRDELFALGLIGILPEGIGYGNISLRGPGNSFLISASATGGIIPIHKQHFSWVRRFDIDENRLYCSGPRPASSESLSHGAIYRASSSVQCVIHAHDPVLFERMPAWGAAVTPRAAAFGTPEMARAIQFLARGQKEIALVMGGHADGILFAAPDIVRAGQLVQEFLIRAGRDGNARASGRFERRNM
jgi:hypothetical protein